MVHVKRARHCSSGAITLGNLLHGQTQPKAARLEVVTNMCFF